jgi:hypothetical protein
MAFWTDAEKFKEPLRSHRWYVQFTGHLKPIMFALKECKKPEYEVSVTEHRRLNHLVPLPGTVKWKPITIKFASVRGDTWDKDAGSLLYKSLLLGGHSSPTSFLESTISKFNYNASVGSGITAALEPAKLNILQLDPAGNEVEVWSLTNAFINMTNFGSLSYESEDIVNIECTITYDYAELNNITRGTSDFNFHTFNIDAAQNEEILRKATPPDDFGSPADTTQLGRSNVDKLSMLEKSDLLKTNIAFAKPFFNSPVQSVTNLQDADNKTYKNKYRDILLQRISNTEVRNFGEPTLFLITKNELNDRKRFMQMSNMMNRARQLEQTAKATGNIATSDRSPNPTPPPTAVASKPPGTDHGKELYNESNRITAPATGQPANGPRTGDIGDELRAEANHQESKKSFDLENTLDKLFKK